MLGRKKEAEFLRDVTFRNGIEWAEKCKMGACYEEERMASAYSSFEVLIVMLCMRMCGALFMAVLLADKYNQRTKLGSEFV